MRVHPYFLASPRLAGWSLVLLLALGCEDPRPGPVGVVQQVAISVPSPTLRPGRQMTARARPLDADGGLVEIPVQWRSLTPSLLAVDAEGELRAIAPGTGIVEAVAGGVIGRLEIALVNPPAALLRVPNDTLRLTLSGAPATLAARAFDAQGEELIGAPFEFSAEAARIASIGTTGIVTPVAIGTTTVAVAIDGLREVRTIVVGTVPSASAPVITAISTTTILPGVPFTIRGERFAATSALNSALVDGLPLTVTAASATQLTALLPASGVPCLPTRTVAVQVTTPGGAGAGVARLEVAPQRTLAVGEALILTSGSAAACNEFADGAGRYLVAVQHGGRALGAGSIALALEGRTGSGPVVAMQAPNVLGSVHDARGSHRLDRHAQLLAASAEAARAARVANAVPSAPPLASLQVPPVNGIVQVRVPDLTSSNLCTSFTTIGARTVYEGARVAILEDTVSRRDGVPTLAGTMDELYSQIGQEVDAVLWPLARRFGDPLVMDSRLDANDRVVLVATPRLNAMLNGEILGAVVTCDFFARAQFASSNVGEVMYLQVPTSTAPGIGPGTRERWRHEIRGTIAHELKHLVSYAGRIVRNQPLEEVWLEEATARHAEELFARARLGFTPTADMGYAALDCEVRALQGATDCADTPRTMLPHFEGLWDFLGNPSALTPLGPVAPRDVSFYGSGWSLTRWAIDHSGQPEEVVLQQLIASGQSGIANLEARVGRSWDEILGRWALALVAESRAVQATDATVRLPSWNLADVFSGLCTNLGSCGAASGSTRFSRAQALRPIVLGAASFALTLPELVPGGFSAIDVTPGAPGTRRLIRLRSATTPFLPPTARLAILRVE
jgi:hypothetical protein